jgi:hypothetical protein
MAGEVIPNDCSRLVFIVGKSSPLLPPGLRTAWYRNDAEYQYVYMFFGMKVRMH